MAASQLERVLVVLVVDSLASINDIHIMITYSNPPRYFNLDGRFIPLPKRIFLLLVGRTEREIMKELRHEIRVTLQAISDGLKDA